jgi:hypothetical protein
LANYPGGGGPPPAAVRFNAFDQPPMLLS